MEKRLQQTTVNPKTQITSIRKWMNISKSHFTRLQTQGKVAIRFKIRRSNVARPSRHQYELIKS